MERKSQFAAAINHGMHTTESRHNGGSSLDCY
jgi:hypothetical protein